MYTLTKDELKAVKYYIGDVSAKDGFWGEPKAYLVLNSLFYPEIVSEKARASEGKYLSPEIIADTERLLEFYQNLFSTFRKTTVEADTITYRVERYSDYLLCCFRNSTVSMTSSSKSGFLNAYRDRSGIALMKFSVKSGIPCIPVEKVLDIYIKSEEEEILLPPFLNLKIKELPINEEYMKITDSDNMPPVVHCEAEPLDLPKFEKINVSLPKDGEKAGQRIYKALNEKIPPKDDDIFLFNEWKEKLHIILKNMI